MENLKKCIFHIPNQLDAKGMSGSQIRPRKMINAFNNIGYDVDVVMGYGTERKKAIKKIEENIKKGVHYDFLYSESSTMPTVLTEKDHFPRYFKLDFDFFKFCKLHGIRIGLFYRDIYWRFPVYKESVHGLKFYMAQLAYRYDLYKYGQLLDYLYVPNMRMDKYIKRKKLSMIMEELPPGCIEDDQVIIEKSEFYDTKLLEKNRKINLFYVGGLGNQYIFDELLKGVKELNWVTVTICCRKDEWEKNKSRLSDLLTNRVSIVHKSGSELQEYYKNADICLAFFKPDIYIEMAVPIKLFEYLSYAIPVLVSNNTAAGEFVQKNGIGWTIDYNAEQVKVLFNRLKENYEEIYAVHQKCKNVLTTNRWEDRALQVKRQLGDK